MEYDIHAGVIAVAPREHMAAAKILRQSIVIVTAALPLHPKVTAPAPPAVAAAVAMEVGIFANADLIFWICSSLPPLPILLGSVAASTANAACVVVVVGEVTTSEPQ